MQKSIFFRDNVVDIIEDYADKNKINFNKAVNNIIEEHVEIEELRKQIVLLEAELQKEKNSKGELIKNMTDRFDRIELLISNDTRTHIG